MIVGTAGHVDHGKTSLVRALTGIDTDRLAEEKRRGISIELGFAYAALDGDGTKEAIGFVDVPGHRKFVQTMIAGAAGIDVALLVVAADDGPMPQTREHVDILRWLGIARVVVAITKIDRVDAARVDDVVVAMRDLLAGAAYRDVPVFPVASIGGVGIDALKRALLALRDDVGPRVATSAHFRLSIDRAFVLKGIGLVVTGTATAGHVAVDDELTLLPGRRVVRVRGIHAHDAAATTAHAGQRVALNIVGRDVEQDTVHRGDWVVAPTIAILTDRMDVALDADTAFDARTWRHVRCHVGAASCNARVALLFGRIAQVVFDEPQHVVVGDRFVLRDASVNDGAGSLAGGIVLDVDVPPRGRRGDARRAFLETAATGDARATLSQALSSGTKGLDLARWNAARNTDLAAADVADAHAVVTAHGVTLFAHAAWETLRDRVVAALADEHARAPDTVGPGRDRLRRMAAPAVDAAAFGALIDGLRADGRIAQTAAWLHLPDHRVTLSADDRARHDRARGLLAAAPHDPPRIRDLARALGDDEAALRGTFVRLASRGLVYRVAHDHYFLPQTVRGLAAIAVELATVEGVAKAAPFRDRIGVGRKVAIHILEFFDRTGFTRRIGDDHRVIQPGLFGDLADGTGDDAPSG